MWSLAIVVAIVVVIAGVVVVSKNDVIGKNDEVIDLILGFLLLDCERRMAILGSDGDRIRARHVSLCAVSLADMAS